MDVKNLNTAFEGFTSSDVTSEVLGEGQHKVKLISFAAIHSKAESNGEMKDKEYPYEDVTPQVYTVFGSVENKGAIAHRFNLEGYRKYDDLTPAEKEDERFSCSNDGVALKLNKQTGKISRIPDATKTNSARNILSQAMSGMGLPAGSGIGELATVRNEQREFMATVVAKEYEGKKYMEIKKISAIKVGAEIGAETFA